MARKGFLSALTLFGLLAVLVPNPATGAGDEGGGEEWIRDVGDILQIALPVIGGGSTFFTNPDSGKSWDKEGTKQFAWAYGTAWATTYFLKIVASKARPNGDNRTSFPSGHTMSAFAGAAFIDSRYGKAVGIPAYALAVFTGYSRVQSQWHYRDDVLAGASIGMISNWHFVSPQPGRFALLPTVSAQGLGVTVSVRGDDGGQEPRDTRPRGAAYGFGFGPAFLIGNAVGGGGAPFELGDLQGHNDPTTTAVVGISVPLGGRSRITGMWGPFEARDKGSFQQEVTFGGSVFPAGTELDSAWRFYDLSLRYEYEAIQSRAWVMTVGGGLGLTYSYTDLTSADKSISALVDDTAFYPFGLVKVRRQFSERFGLEVVGEGIALGDNWMIDAGADLIYTAGRAWDLALGYTYLGRKIETDTYYNKVRYSIPHLTVTRYW